MTCHDNIDDGKRLRLKCMIDELRSLEAVFSSIITDVESFI